eukprot:gene50180-41988_t
MQAAIASVKTAVGEQQPVVYQPPPGSSNKPIYAPTHVMQAPRGSRMLIEEVDKQWWKEQFPDGGKAPEFARAKKSLDKKQVDDALGTLFDSRG